MEQKATVGLATGGEHGGRAKIDGSRAEPSNTRPTLADIGTSAVPTENRTPTLADIGIDKKLLADDKKLSSKRSVRRQNRGSGAPPYRFRCGTSRRATHTCRHRQIGGSLAEPPKDTRPRGAYSEPRDGWRVFGPCFWGDQFDLPKNPYRPANLTPGPPPFSAMNSTPADSRAARIAATVAGFNSSPRSRREIVFGETSALAANSRMPSAVATLAILHCVAFIDSPATFFLRFTTLPVW